MCGIAGIYSLKGNIRPEAIKKMTALLGHRGPDDNGFLGANSVKQEAYLLSGEKSCVVGPSIDNFDKSVNLFFGHRRLSIIDLSPGGHQPMCNENGQVWIVYNGEIFNYPDVRRELEPLGHRFKSQTDTEVILHAYEEWGTDCHKHFNGMWAFAIFDLRANRIFCSRDRFGIKPFYYTYDGRRFCFASEIKAFLETELAIEPNEQMIADYLFSGMLDHTEETFFKGVYQLRPGEYLLIESNQLKVRSYWDVECTEVRFPRGEDYADRFYELLKDSIRLRLRSDVPIGTCLSGGVDSSSIVCLANRLMFDGQPVDLKDSEKRQKTFSSCFKDNTYDERKYIELVIQQTGAEKNYVFPEAKRLHEDMAKLIWYQDEPFGSTSIFAQWEVMRLARQRGVTVLLDGQGGDELFGGYPPSYGYLFYEKLRHWRLGRLWKELEGFRKHHTANMLAVTVSRWIGAQVSRWMEKKIDWAEEPFQRKYLRYIPRPSKFENDLDNYLYHCLRSTTLPRLLHYEDRNSMAFSIEARLPFLDFRLVEYIFSLPTDQKIKDGITKIVLREAMKGTLPEPVRNRYDKMGFITPENIWFRTVLKENINEVIRSKSFAGRGYLIVGKVKKAFEDFCNGKADLTQAIWRWVNTELWFRMFIDKKKVYDG
jgi:asparagine synthase (glutamine-hydrolysing)